MKFAVCFTTALAFAGWEVAAGQVPTSLAQVPKEVVEATTDQ
jgi:hypothetical protein